MKIKFLIHQKMINDFNKDNYFSSFFEKIPLIRNISYEMNKGEHIFLDNKGNNYICNIYGDKRPKFQDHISGFINGEQRKVMKNSKSLSDILISNRYKLSKNSKEEKQYLPSLNKFEGYSHFPRPICSPLGNIPYYIMKKNIKVMLKNELIKSFEKEKNKNLFKKEEEENKGLSYITSNIKGVMENGENNNNINSSKTCKSYNKDKTLLIRLINSTCNEISNRSINTLKDIKDNSHTVRALNHLRYKLLNNDETSMINGRKLKEPSKYMINEYKIINNRLFNEFKSNSILNKHRNLIKSFSQFDMQVNKIINSNKSDSSKYLTGRKIIDKITINNLTRSQNCLKKRILFPNTIDTSIKKENLNKSEENLKHNLLNITRNRIIPNLKRKTSSFNPNDSKTIKKHNMLDDQETKESLGSKPHNNNLFLIRSISNENNKTDNISFISEKYNIFRFRKNIRYLKHLEKKSIDEKRLLEGYKIEEPKKPKIFGPKEDDQPKYKDFGEIYKKELETLEKCNPILFELEKKKNEKEIEKLKRKKEFKKLEEKMKLKGKTLKIKKIKKEN